MRIYNMKTFDLFEIDHDALEIYCGSRGKKLHAFLKPYFRQLAIHYLENNIRIERKDSLAILQLYQIHSNFMATN